MKSLNNRLLYLVFIFSFLFTHSFLKAQSDCNCCTQFHQKFDFWVGEWNVYDTADNKVGENSIVKLENGCIINEHWQGAKGETGRSYNYFNKTDSTWNQLWIDSQGNHLELKGGYEMPGKMILSSELIPGQKVDFYRNRITWTKNQDGTVSQLWEILDKNENLLAVAFDGIYRRK